MARNSIRVVGSRVVRKIRSIRFAPWKQIVYVAQQWGPSRRDSLALISLDESPFKAVWPVANYQIVGGKRWSFGVTVYTNTPKLERKKFKKFTNPDKPEK